MPSSTVVATVISMAILRFFFIVVPPSMLCQAYANPIA